MHYKAITRAAEAGFVHKKLIGIGGECSKAESSSGTIAG
jgi:hypothetical protein